MTRLRLLILAGMAAATLMLIGASSASAQQQCPPGQTGNPPYCQTPPGGGGVSVQVVVNAQVGCNSLKVLRIKSFKSGTAMVQVCVPLAAKVSVRARAGSSSNAKAKAYSRTTRFPADKISLVVKPSDATRKVLLTGKSVRLPFDVRMLPTGGAPTTKSAKAWLYQRPPAAKYRKENVRPVR